MLKLNNYRKIILFLLSFVAKKYMRVALDAVKVYKTIYLPITKSWQLVRNIQCTFKNYIIKKNLMMKTTRSSILFMIVMDDDTNMQLKSQEILH